jgi:Mor family transcriptional regulator
MTESTQVKLDPLTILREELIAAALCHGVERCEELADSTVKRYVDRMGGVQTYVKSQKRVDATRVASEIVRRHNGRNTFELAREFSLSIRQVQRIISSAYHKN